VQHALRYNPGLRAAELGVQASEHDIASARSGHYPRLSATASYNRSRTFASRASDGVDVGDSENDNATISVQLDVPIFAGGAVRSRVRQAIHSNQATLAQLDQQRRAVGRQTRSVYRSVLAGIAEIEARGAALASAASAYEASEAGLEVGTRTIVEVLINQQNLFAAQREYANARHSFLVNTLRLKQATGQISVDDLRAVDALLTVDADAAAAPAVEEPQPKPARARRDKPIETIRSSGLHPRKRRKPQGRGR
jgi:outer membrane protein